MEMANRDVTIGVLSLQGSVAEHMQMLRQIEGVTPLEVKTLEALEQIDGLILPGGESTTISKLLRMFDLHMPIKERILAGMPVWGTCAGMILLAKEIVGETAHFGVMDITVRRNAYGTQLDSFTQKVVVPAFSDQPIPLTFIRAPWIERVNSDAVNVLCQLNGHIVAAQEGNLLATSYHPEITDDLTTHRYFAQLCKDTMWK